MPKWNRLPKKKVHFHNDDLINKNWKTGSSALHITIFALLRRFLFHITNNK